ncbi:hypothetical protein [Tomitella gaofuii]|uniref:hypothetical protein n=1 Tax=Tomitella gaofuii TaxID=2760083 RepID=UPI0015FD8B65|nr:hypothetical protein [Tomitella gaofuii]
MRADERLPGAPPPRYPGAGQGNGGSGDGPPAAPPAVRIAYELWCVVAVLGIGTTVGVILVMSGLQDTVVDEMLERFSGGVNGQPVTRADVVSSFHLSLGVIGVLGAVVIGLTWLVARRMLRGKAWARAVLVGFTAIITVIGFEGLLGFNSNGSVVLEVCAILQAVLAIGASVIVHRGEAHRYFYGGRPR